MLLSQIPQKFQISFASGAQPSFITAPIPTAAQPNGRASLTTGFSELNFDPIAAGGIPPWGKDFNGLLNQITAWLRWCAAGGFPVSYDSEFSAAIGGYPQYALLRRASGVAYWISLVDNNTTNPDAGGAGWSKFPDVIVQKQAGNYAEDIGTPNAYRITLDPLPASLASIIGSPMRVMAAGPNTIINPTIRIDNVAGDLPVTIINSSGAPLLVNQIARSGQIFEGYYDGTVFQLTSPAPIAGQLPFSPVVTGVIYAWSAETVPTWGLECNGATPLISTYPNLFNVVGTRWGGDGINTFGVPDLRGAFMRGWDHGRGLDPNATTRTRFQSGGGVVGDHVGSWENQSMGSGTLTGRMTLENVYGEAATPAQIDANNLAHFIGTQALTYTPNSEIVTQFSAVTHDAWAFNREIGKPGNPNWELTVSTIIARLATFEASGSETRPVNADVMYVIAY